MRFMYLSVLFIAGFTGLAIYGSGESRPDSFKDNKEMIVLRKIGHEVLLSAGDKHSRVLPVKQVSNRQFRIGFENPLSIVPDSVVKIFRRIARDNNLAEYMVNITDCRKNEIVYGFAVSAPGSNNDVVPCLERGLPKDCYYISLWLPDRQKGGLTNMYYTMAAVAAAVSLYWWLRSRRKSRRETDTGYSGNNSTNPVVKIGRYNFYPQQQYLELNGENTPLTNKEARLLNILAAAPNTLIDRSLLQKEVWENDGVIVTRSLDMFISKLRKKLSGDTSIRIINAHGKGYRLETV